VADAAARALSGRVYAHLREGGKKVLRPMPTVWELARRSGEHLKGMVLPWTLFEEMGFNYIGPMDGHYVKALVSTLRNVHKLRGPQLLQLLPLLRGVVLLCRGSSLERTHALGGGGHLDLQAGHARLQVLRFLACVLQLRLALRECRAQGADLLPEAPDLRDILRQRGLALAQLCVAAGQLACHAPELRCPLLILGVVPLATLGGLLSLHLTGETLNVASGVGFIALFGVAVLNGVVLVTFINPLREQGAAVRDAVVQGSLTRLRPVLMTAVAMFVGMLPMSLGLADGSEANAALAKAVLGGIAFGTCSTLLFVPFLYTMLRRGEAKPLEEYV